MFIRILCLNLNYPKQGCWCLRLNKGNRSSSDVNQLDIETEESVTKGPQQLRIYIFGGLDDNRLRQWYKATSEFVQSRTSRHKHQFSRGSKLHLVQFMSSTIRLWYRKQYKEELHLQSDFNIVVYSIEQHKKPELLFFSLYLSKRICSLITSKWTRPIQN